MVFHQREMEFLLTIFQNSLLEFYSSLADLFSISLLPKWDIITYKPIRLSLKTDKQGKVKETAEFRVSALWIYIMDFER